MDAKTIKKVIVPANREPTEDEKYGLIKTEHLMQNDIQDVLYKLKILGKWSGGYESNYYQLK